MEEKLSRREVREGAFIILYQTLFGQTPQEITCLLYTSDAADEL